MQNDPRWFAGQGGYGGYYGYGTPAPPSVLDALPPLENGVELQATVNCPENYVIFDHTNNRSRIMYNPTGGHDFNFQTSQQYQNWPANVCNPSSSSSFKEDSDEIDALLSLENDEEDEEDDVVSTGRTPTPCERKNCNSPDSICSTGGSMSGRHRPASPAAVESTSAGTSKGTKKERMRRMVKTLRGIVPGAKQMDTPAFLDEAVRYLKSLKVEARKLGIKN